MTISEGHGADLLHEVRDRLNVHEDEDNRRFEAINERLIRTAVAVESHERYCEHETQQALWAAGIFAAIIGALFGYILFISGRQEQILARLDEMSARMIAIVEANVSRERGTREDLKEIRDQLREHDARKSPG